MERSASYDLNAASGPLDEEGSDSMTREKSHQTLADLKRQRAAAKLNKCPAPPPPLTPPLEEEPPSAAASEVASPPGTRSAETAAASPSQVFFTPASGDPPLLKLRAPEEDQSTNKEPCCRLM